MFVDALDSMLVIDCESGEILAANKATERVFGYNPSNIIGQHFSILFPARRVSGADEFADDVRVHDMVFHQEFRCADGSLRPMDLTAVMLDDPDRCKILATLRDVAERAAMEEQISRQTHTDSLTGLLLRGEFMRRLRQEFQRSLRYDIEFSVCFCDIDDFKFVNDNYGHAAGDSALQGFARHIEVELRRNDFVGRYGGDEFIIAFPHTGVDNAFSVVERIHRRIATRPIKSGHHMMKITGSFGLAASTPGVTDVETLLEHGDRALYQAKREGRNRIRVYNDRGKVSDLGWESVGL